MHLGRFEGTWMAPSSRRWTLERTVVMGFAAALLLLCLVSIISIRSTRALVSQNQLEGDAFDQLLHMTDLVSRLKDAETGQRGYLLTGEEQYLQPYRDALTGLETDLKSLRQSSSNNPELRERLNRIEPLIRQKLAELEQTITLRRERGYEAAIAVVKTDKGRQLMDDIRKVLAEMRDQGEGRVKARAAEAAVSARQTTVDRGRLRGDGAHRHGGWADGPVRADSPENSRTGSSRGRRTISPARRQRPGIRHPHA